MHFLKLSRRSFLFALPALAACQTTGKSNASGRTTTEVYDGSYEIVVSRLWNETAQNLSSPFFTSEPETLATLQVQCLGGRCEILSLVNESPRGYEDFDAVFLEGGIFALNTTVGYLKGSGNTATHFLRVRIDAGERLLSGERVIIEPSNGYSANHSPHVSIRKL